MTTSTNTSPVVEFRQVSKIFNDNTPQAFTALENVSFQIDDTPGRGEFIAIVGDRAAASRRSSI